MSDDKEEAFVLVPWSAFENILAALYELSDVLSQALEDAAEPPPPLHLVPKPPKENGH